MKHLLTPLLLLISLTGLAQPTYLDLFIQFDQYPGETSWTLTQDTIPIATSPDYGFQEYVGGTVEQTLFLESGVEYTFTITDDFGDGICCGFGAGYFTLENDCQGLIVENLEFGDSIAEYTFTLAPCVFIPPTADVTFRVDLANAPPGIEVPGVLGSWNGWQVIPMTLGGNGIWFADVEVPLGNHLWKFADFNNPEVQELPAGVNDSPCFLFDEFGFINRTLNVTTEEEIILPPYCWESCLPCGGIAGCTDFNALNWNPWANFDNGSCISQDIQCNPDETIIEIIVTPDNFGGETSWTLYSALNDGAIASAPAGTYAESPPGIPISIFLCVPIDVEYDLVILDTYGDGLCGTCFGGSVTGNVQIFDCEGEELYNLQDEHPDGNFGYDTLSPMFVPTECSTTAIVEGCTDSDYVEYNPEATNNDGSCLTEKIYGCTDPTQFNFNEEANTEEIIESCEFNLTIKDGVGDGWFGSWLGIWQFGYNSPQYQMGPNDGIEESFTLTLDATQPAYIYFFVTPQSIATAQQCGFTLTNPNGDIIIDVPFFSAIPFINESGWYVYEVTPYCGNICEPYIYGCTAPQAINYNDEANSDDESCVYSPGCTNPAYVEYSEEADLDDGSCSTLVVFGCTDPDAFNFDEEANTDNDGCIPKIFGCTNELAFNYDPNANTPDGSCVAVEEGCTDPTAFNYEEEANTDNGSCIPVTFGCTDETAFNYNPLANTNNDSCIPIIYGCTDNTAYNYNVEANTDDNSCEDIVEGCTQSNQFNYNPDANTDDGSCYPFVYGCLNPNSYTYNDYDNDGVGNPLTGINGVDVNTNNNLCVPFIYGCLDETAFNYNPDANTEDVNNPCEPFVYGCMDPTQFNYNVNANTDDGSCIEFVYGCTDELAFNYDPLANTNVGCESVIQGCTDPEAFNFNILANTDDGTCVDVVFGCTDETAFNYNPLANTNVGCESVVEGCTDEEAINYNPQANTDNGTCEAEVFGCTDPTAFNFDSNANTDNGSCEEVIFGCLDENALNYNPDANTDNGSCVEEIAGCTDPLALNYNELANVEDGSCIDAIYGCTDPNAFNYNELANSDNGTCEDIVEGCTDPTAFNYNPDANTEDFSCIEVVYGCTEEYAVNYNPEANVDSGDCEAVYTGCMEQDEYLSLNLIDPAFAWVISVSPSCCSQDGGIGWTGGCQELHDYWLDNNEVTSIEEYGETQIIVFPNPTRDIITIASSLNVNATLYNAVGQPIYQNNNVQQIDLSKYEAGIYNLILTYNDLQFTKKIIKQ